MIRRFRGDIRGNFGMITAFAMLPIMGGLALAVDYGEMNREKQVVANALDAAGMATGRQIVSGASDAELIAYATDFFHANLGKIDPADTTLNVTLPSNAAGGGTLKLSAVLNYKPYFFPVFKYLLNNSNSGPIDINLGAKTEIRLKDTLEVALALDNSGSMSDEGTGSGEERIDLLKDAAKQLVDMLAAQAALIKQVDKPVQFAVVPFAASVNVGPQNADQSWMDQEGLSPVHHENFDWASMSTGNRRAEKVDGKWVKAGSDWGDEEGDLLTRFSLYQDMKYVSSREWVSTGKEYVCTQTSRRTGACTAGHWQDTGYYDNTISQYSSWQGCVEERPYPYGDNDAAPDASNPATLFVPMFAPDEPGDRWATDTKPNPSSYGASNNYWNDNASATTGRDREQDMAKYFVVRPYGVTSSKGTGPNYSCTTNPVTPLTDVTVPDGLKAVKDAIDAMAPNGGTSVPSGLAWGWRAVSSGAPFTEGRPDGQKGNDKVVIVLTDGANTYYTPGSLGYSDPAGNKSIYADYGYLLPTYDGASTSRLFQGTDSSVGQFDYSNDNYTTAMNEHMAALCANAKAAGVTVMTVALDLDETKSADQGQIAALRSCSSNSRFRTDPATGLPAKLFWNATGATLSEDFKEIGNELSNLRIVG
ncbi:MAG: pilus assembly protein TadG-related protein [Rhizobiaceae bacterium]